MRRYENRSTLMTSNRPLEDWGKLVGDVPTAAAILDRFLHHARVVTFAGKSFRLKNAAIVQSQLPNYFTECPPAPAGSFPSARVGAPHRPSAAKPP